MLKAPKRNIASAIDLLEQDYDSVVGGIRFTELPLHQIQPFHDHRFRLYEGQRLEDMVESVREYGVMTPVIVLKLDDTHYEMLSGHNRLQAAQLAGLKTIPALVKEGLTEDECLAYVIETNLLQRSFTDMRPSEQAAVLQVRSISCPVRDDEAKSSENCGFLKQALRMMRTPFQLPPYQGGSWITGMVLAVSTAWGIPLLPDCSD